MFKDLIQSQVIGTLKIYDKDSGDILVQKKNAIHPGNMAYVLASALAGKPTSVNGTGDAPHINWMQFGNGGSVSTTTLSYKSPRVNSTYDELAITASNSSLYVPTYEQLSTNTVYFPGEDMGAGEIVPNNTAKVNFSVNLTHADYALAVSETIPANDASTDASAVEAFTFDEIGLMSGVTDSGALDKTKTLMLTHVTFHPVLLSANRTIVIDYTVTIQIS
tara:strand:- start:1441 stop:2100 length:660 start_codon:yes stop_codon:yes gene_type:complete